MNLFQVMLLHPQYLKIYNKSQSFIMRGDGPLPFHYRHYIAIMVSYLSVYFGLIRYLIGSNSSRKTTTTTTLCDRISLLDSGQKKKLSVLRKSLIDYFFLPMFCCRRVLLSWITMCAHRIAGTRVCHWERSTIRHFLSASFYHDMKIVTRGPLN